MNKRIRTKKINGTRRSRWLSLVKLNGTRQRKDWAIHDMRYDDRGSKTVIPAGQPFTIQSLTFVFKG